MRMGTSFFYIEWARVSAYFIDKRVYKTQLTDWLKEKKTAILSKLETLEII